MISDVPNIVRVFGGENLYGDDPKVALREMVQNAADAVRARRILVGDPCFGRIVVRRRKIESATWLEVEDNGIGMSARVLTGPLLDFGHSFWTGTMVREEFPGLFANGMQPTGKFGIGFFSIFMLGDQVTVTSKRFDKGTESARTLEFRGGLDARPILRELNLAEAIPNGGTRVSVKLARTSESGLLALWGPLARDSLDESSLTSLTRLVARMCTTADVDIDVEIDGERRNAVRSNDWISMPAEKLLRRVLGFVDEDVISSVSEPFLHFAPVIRELKDDTRIYGRAGIAPILGSYGIPLFCIVTVGGLVATSLRSLAGVLIGNRETVARNYALPSVPPAVLESWAAEQSKLLNNFLTNNDEKMHVAKLVMLCGADPGDLPIAQKGSDYLNCRMLRDQFLEVEEVRFIIERGNGLNYDKSTDECSESKFHESFSLSSSLYFFPEEEQAYALSEQGDWPDYIYPKDSTVPRSPKEAFLLAVAQAWECELDDLKEFSESEYKVGDVAGTPIVRQVRLLHRQNRAAKQC